MEGEPLTRESHERSHFFQGERENAGELSRSAQTAQQEVGSTFVRVLHAQNTRLCDCINLFRILGGIIDCSINRMPRAVPQNESTESPGKIPIDLIRFPVRMLSF